MVSLEDEDRQSLLTTLFDVVDQRENTRSAFRTVVLRFSIGMLPFYIVALVFTSRVGAALDERSRSNLS